MKQKKEKCFVSSNFPVCQKSTLNTLIRTPFGHTKKLFTAMSYSRT